MLKITRMRICGSKRLQILAVFSARELTRLRRQFDRTLGVAERRRVRSRQIQASSLYAR